MITPLAPAAASQNACKQCAPLGASLAFRGIEGAMLVIHGSQGCATYIRRYMISHFREPMDIASSSLDETAAIFGGQANLHRSLRNVVQTYQPQVIGVATTCLSETIGENVPSALREFAGSPGLHLVPVSTPSYQGSQAEGFHRSVRALVESLAISSPGSGQGDHVVLFCGMLSPADLRHLKAITRAFDLNVTLLPDYSDTLDGVAEARYRPIPLGGTPVDSIHAAGAASISLFFGPSVAAEMRGSDHLARSFDVPERVLEMPIGVRNTDAFTEVLSTLAERPLPPELAGQRGRLIDAYVDGHKIVFGKRAILFGDEDLVTALAGFLLEIGMVPALCATGGSSGHFGERLTEEYPEASAAEIEFLADADFAGVAARARVLAPDLLIGSSKGYPLARELNVPLLRVGFPIHDRLGAQRLLHVGYAGTQHLFDALVNELLRRRQDESPLGYAYL